MFVVSLALILTFIPSAQAAVVTKEGVFKLSQTVVNSLSAYTLEVERANLVAQVKYFLTLDNGENWVLLIAGLSVPNNNSRVKVTGTQTVFVDQAKEITFNAITVSQIEVVQEGTNDNSSNNNNQNIGQAYSGEAQPGEGQGLIKKRFRIKQYILAKLIHQFKDVIKDAWYAPYVNLLALREVIGGYGDGRFGPGDMATRGQLVKIVLKTARITLNDSATNPFPDVEGDNPFLSYILTAYQHGWISGYANGNFGPNDPVTRGQAAKIIVNVFGMTLVNPMTPTFTDVPKDNPFYRFVETLAFHEIVQGREDGQFGVNDKIIRAEIAKVVTLASGHAATSALKDDLEQY
ncbi:hypothetical protein AUJ78_00105 [Candidatus Peregrinibacteria bacterium CG1_02_41_10]|nr:MAG: hypothetical protein AUJ78_00105 [Candidatus Peregrinibacteria bacterium CG1_02_41_10]